MMGAVLMQVDENGIEHPVSFYSKKSWLNIRKLFCSGERSLVTVKCSTTL